MITSSLIKILPYKLRAKAEDNHELRKIMGNINWLTAGVIFKDILGLFIVAWVARYLGPKQFGTMNYAVAFVALFSTFSTLGLDNIIIRNILLKTENKDEYLGTAFVLKLLGSFILLILSSIVIYFVQSQNFLIRLFVLILAFGYIFKAFDVIDFWFQSKIEAKYSVYARSISFGLVSILKVILIITQSSLVSFVLMFSLDFLLIAIFMLYFYIKREGVSIMRWRASLKTAKELLGDSWPLILSGIAVMIYMKIDQVMIGGILGEKDLGIYSSAVKLSEAWYFIPNIVSVSVFPSILNTKRKSEKLYRERLQMLYDSFTWFTILVAIVVSLSSPLIIKTLYGDEYIKASSVLAVHIWAGVGVFGGVAVGKYLIAENLTKISLFMTSIGAICNIILNVFLIPRFGIIGAAYSTLITYIIATYSVLIFKDSKEAGFQLLRSFNILRVFRRVFL
jgi:O-antigen/teichoic acid export membrane protein